MKSENECINANDDFDFFDFSDVDPLLIKTTHIANQIVALMSHEGINRTNLASRLGWKNSRLSAVLSGKRNLTIKTMLSLSSALDYDFTISFFKENEYESHQPWDFSNKMVDIEPTIFNACGNIRLDLQTQSEVLRDIASDSGSDMYVSINFESSNMQTYIGNSNVDLITNNENAKESFKFKDIVTLGEF